MSILDSLPHLCKIFRQIRTNDGLGGNVYGVVTEQSNVECWEQPASASEMKEYEKRGIKVSTKVYFVTDPAVDERHRILITSRQGVAQANLDGTDVTNPDTLCVQSSARPDASAGLGILWRVMCDATDSNTQ